MRNLLKVVRNNITDLAFRVRNKAIRAISSKTVISTDDSKSDSEVSFYVSSVDEINSNPEKFDRFRRIYNYREILEHVTYRLGIEYLKKMKVQNPNLYLNFPKTHPNDLVGQPRKYEFFQGADISPTTIRYLSVASEIQSIFGSNLSGNVVEIGGGYGGQCSIFQDFFKPREYAIYDLPNVQRLIEKYLTKIGQSQNVVFPEYGQSSKKSINFAISNYAFSELPRQVQIWYLENVLKYSEAGYMIMNSGRTDFTGRNTGKLTIQEIQAALPGSKLIEEIPKTNPDNYVLIWGTNLNLEYCSEIN
jgi:putative sugar O-methyltransferase